MSLSLLDLYHRLPPGLRSAAASLRGGYLRAWRYGPGFERRVDAAFERETWSEAQWRDWKEERLAFVLHRAATRVPHYRAYWSARRRVGDRAAWDLVENWPLLEKEALRKNPRAFVADDRSTARMLHEHTSGTTGKAIQLWRSRETLREWYALYEARCRRWYGVSRHDRWAIVGGQLVAPAGQQDPPFWVWNAALHQLYLSAYHVAPSSIAAYLQAVRGHRVRFLLGYPSALFALAHLALEHGLTAPTLSVVVANAEPLPAHQRATIAAAFGCAVRDTYGMSEAVAAASECVEGTLHEWPEVGHAELLTGDDADEACELVATSLLDADMPLVRYRVGDRVRRAPPGRCSCGRTLPRFGEVDGRTDDVLYTVEGRVVGRLDPVFKQRLQVREAQIIQHSLDTIVVRVVPAAGYGARDARSIIDRVCARMGAVDVRVEEVAAIPRAANGKFRAVVCRLTPEERRRVGAA